MKTFQNIFFTIAVVFMNSMPSYCSDGIPELFKVKLNDYVKQFPSHRAYMQLDKSVYNPGNSIWFKVIIADYFSGIPVDDSQKIKVNLQNPGNMMLVSLNYDVDHGQCEGHLPLPPTLTAGNYYVTVTGNNLPNKPLYFKEIVVKEAVVPAFIISADIPNKTYMPGDEIEGTVKFTDYYNEPLKNIEYEVIFNDGRRDVTVVHDKSDKSGTGIFKYKIPSKLPFGTVLFTVTANKKGEYELLEGLVPVTSETVFLRMWPEGGQLLAGIENKVTFQCIDAVGDPYDFEGQVLDSNGKVVVQVKSDDKGLGNFKIKPERNGKYTMRIVRPYLLDKIFDLPEVNNAGITMKILEKDQNEIKLQIRSPYKVGSTYYLIGMNGNKIFWSESITVEDNMTMNIPMPAEHNRILNFSLFNLTYVAESELSVMTSSNTYSCQISTDKQEYEPRGKVVVSVKMSGIDPGMLENITLTAVNRTWNEGISQLDLMHQLNFPVDFEEDALLRNSWQNAAMTETDQADLMTFYHPTDIDWSAIMAVEQTLKPTQPEEYFIKNIQLKDKVLSTNTMNMDDKKIEYVNTTTDNYFLASNPGYISFLNTKVVKRKEGYKVLLENGISVKEVVNSIKPYSLENNKIIFMGSRNSLYYQDGALIVVDGMQLGTDASVLDNISPYDVDKIFVSTDPNDIQRYTGLNSVGLIEITTKRGGSIENEVTKDYDPNEQFQSPDYSSGSKDLHNNNDYRSTLYWDPKVQMQNNQATITFYNADLRDFVDLTVEAIDKKGNITSATASYKVSGLNN